MKIETVLELRLTAYTDEPSAEIEIFQGPLPVAIVLVPESAPVLALRVKMLTVLPE